MTATITAVAQPSNVPPRVQLTIAGVATATAFVYRTDPTGVIGVRGAEPVALVSGGAVVFDYEIPHNTTVSYALDDSSGTQVATATGVSVAATVSWLVHPTVPALSQIVNMLLTEHVQTLPSGVVLQAIPGRPDPIPIGDGARKTASSTVTFYTDTSSDETAMRALISGTVPLLAQLMDTRSSVSVYEWWSLGDVPLTNGGGVFSDPWREWPLAYTVVGRPSGSVLAEWEYGDVLADYTSYYDVSKRYLTYTGLLTGVEGT